MNPLEYLQVLRRHRGLIVAVMVIGLSIGFVTAPGTGAPPSQYRATHTLVVGASLDNRSINLAQAALLVTRGEVPNRVAQVLGENGASLAGQIEAAANSEVGSLEITAIAGRPERAEELANTFATQLLAVLAGDDATEIGQTRDSQLATVNSLSQEIASVTEEITATEAAGADTAALLARRNGVAAEYRLALGALAQLEARAAPSVKLRSLEPARASPLDSGLAATDSKIGRMTILGALALVLSVTLALVLDRVDTRIRVKDDAEKAFGLPVIAEIPPLSRAQRRRNELISISAPVSAYVEAHRSLRTLLLFSRPERDPSEGGTIEGKADHLVILVTSPGAGEGKTSTVAHLAAVFAEAGRSVLVISADLRRPRIHTLFNVSMGPGLSDIELNNLESFKLIEGIHSTNVPGVRLMPSGTPIDNPTRLLDVTKHLIDVAHDLVDIVLVDTPPLLVVNDAAELTSGADAVVVVARSGRTSRQAAERSSEMLTRVSAPVFGAVLVGSTAGSTGPYYRSQYYAVDGDASSSWTQRMRRRLRPSRESTAPPEPIEISKPKVLIDHQGGAQAETTEPSATPDQGSSANGQRPHQATEHVDKL